MARGRKPIPVSREQLQDTIIAVEWDGPFTSRTALWEAVANSAWAKTLGLTAQVAMLKAKAFNEQAPLLIQTPLGQKGKLKGCQPVPKQGKRSRRTALNVVELNNVFKNTPHAKTVAKAVKGSMKSAIKLMCLDCCSLSKKDIALCTIKRCPLWSFRPYQGSYKNEQ